VDIGFVKSTGNSVQINLPRTVLKPEVSFEWKIPHDKQGQPLSNAIERNRARTYFQAYAAAAALHFIEKALAEVRAGHTKTWEKFVVPDEAISVGFTEAVRGVLSHHMVIRGGKMVGLLSRSDVLEFFAKTRWTCKVCGWWERSLEKPARCYSCSSADLQLERADPGH